MMATLDHGRRLAGTHHWWAWDHARIKLAVKGACMEHLLAEVANLFAANQRRARGPAGWPDLARRVHLRRDRRNLERWGETVYLPPPHALLGLATVLEVEVGQLYPVNRRFVAGITTWLCDGQVSDDQALAYAVWRLEKPARAEVECTDELLAALGAALPGHAAAAKGWRKMIEDVLDKLGPILAAIDHDLDKPSPGPCGRKGGC